MFSLRWKCNMGSAFSDTPRILNFIIWLGHSLRPPPPQEKKCFEVYEQLFYVVITLFQNSLSKINILKITKYKIFAEMWKNDKFIRKFYNRMCHYENYLLPHTCWYFKLRYHCANSINIFRQLLANLRLPGCYRSTLLCTSSWCATQPQKIKEIAQK